MAMTYDDFIECLRGTGGYATPPECVRRLPRRLPAWASTVYWGRTFYLVYTRAAMARRGRFDALAWSQGSAFALRTLELAGAQVTIEGVENLAGIDGPVVYVGNHMSFLETFVLPCMVLTAGDVSFVVKESLVTYPVFGAIMRATNPVCVTRKNPREDLKQVLTAGKELLEGGRSVVIFPQATRSTSFVEGQFNSLGAKLAVRAGVPIVPVALKTDFVANGRWLKDFGSVHPDRPVHFAFGSVLSGTNAKELHRQTVEFLRGRLAGWGVPIVAAEG